MKRLFLILLIIFSLPAMAQYDVFGQYNNPFSVWGSKTKTPAGGNYVQRAWDFFNAVTAKGKTLTDAQKRWYNDSIFVPGINHGYIGTTRAGDSLVALYSFSLKWAGDSTVANLNLLDPNGAYNCIHYGGVTYTDSGVVGNGTTGHLNTFFNPISDSSIYRLNSASLLVYSKKAIEENSFDIGGTLSPDWATIGLDFLGSLYCRINSGTAINLANPDSRGVYVASRTSVNGLVVYKNGTSFLTGTTATTTQPNLTFWICALNNGSGGTLFSTRVYPFIAIGGGLSATLSQYISDDLNNALKGAGYNVY